MSRAKTLTVTCDHPASSYGVPVILDSSGKPMDYADGIRAARAQLGGITAAQLADKLGVSERTVNGWEQGRLPNAAALNLLGRLLRLGY